MAKCWTCGSFVSGYRYKCSTCENALRDIEHSLSGGLQNLAEIQERGFNQLSSDLSEISSILEWGFEELSWRLEQQTEVLRSIDHTLKTPSETKAKEWHLHAEELRRRGVLEESEEFFLKALNEYRLDYRIYVGLAETYLQMNIFDKAELFLEKSLPHAPKEENRSYSYRLIGHIYACKENYIKALDVLHSAIKLYPNYSDDIEEIDKKEIDKHFLMHVEDVFTILERGTIVTGRVEHGIIKVGDEIEIVGFREVRKTIVTAIEMFRKVLNEAKAGDQIGVELAEIAEGEIEKGMVLAKTISITPHSKFKAMVSSSYDPECFYARPAKKSC